MNVTESAARNSTVGVSRLVRRTFCMAAWKFSSFCLQKRSISYPSRTNDFTTRMDEMLSCKSDVISAMRSWISVPLRLSLRPKIFIACPTSGMTTSVSSDSFQSSMTIMTMEPMRIEPSVTISMRFVTSAD